MIAYEEETMEQTNEPSPFDGFNGFVCREDWYVLAAFIDNLAEFKIVEWLLRHTWDEWIEVTTETFMHGYFDEEGLKLDYGTGLSKPSVLLGIKKAAQHGLIEQWVDDTDKTRIRKFYRIRVFVASEQVEPQVEQEIGIVGPSEEDYFGVKDLYEETFLTDEEPLPPSMEIENSNYIPSNITCNNISRIQSLETLPERVTSNKKPRGKSKYPGFIRTYMESFSSDLGDMEHTASNISQATNIYLAYIANGGNAKAFVGLMIQAKETTQKKSGIKHRNSSKKRNAMPYYFACLRNAAKSSTERIAV